MIVFTFPLKIVVLMYYLMSRESRTMYVTSSLESEFRQQLKLIDGVLRGFVPKTFLERWIVRELEKLREETAYHATLANLIGGVFTVSSEPDKEE